ncbi:hypothetical protein ONZ45_g9317 [Pleurotus djamor]|nr:hypothetical protein ONZ45_g9317 [Pleurotus djamor]
MPTTRSRARQMQAEAKPQASQMKPSAALEKGTSDTAGKTDMLRKKASLRKQATHPKRVRSSKVGISKEMSIHMAKKKLSIKDEGVRKKIRKSAWSYVYVGNVDPSVTYEQMKNHFDKCGTIIRIQFRCSRGQAVTIGQAIEPSQQTSRDRQYATIEFTRSAAVLSALQLNGSTLNGSKLVVTITPADLPEVEDILNFRKAELAKRGKLLGTATGAGAVIKRAVNKSVS